MSTIAFFLNAPGASHFPAYQPRILSRTSLSANGLEVVAEHYSRSRARDEIKDLLDEVIE